MIIGLSGYAGCGKDTVADLLVKDFGYAKYSFADYVRKGLEILNPRLDESIDLETYLDVFGWEDGKRIPPHGDELRRLMQKFGDSARTLFGPHVFVDALMKELDPADKAVISDVRYPNEALAITNLNGVMWRITRPETYATNDHSSELSMENFPHDVYLLNASDITDLSMSIGEVLGVGFPS
jgi:hypothetical protein